MDEEVRVIAYCAECGEEITDDIEDVYIDEEGNYFDELECAMIYHGIQKLEV